MNTLPASLQHTGGVFQRVASHCNAHPRKRVVGKHGTEKVQNFPQLPAPAQESPLVPSNGNRARRSAKAALGVAGWGLVWANLPPTQG
eukprot:2552950-Prymnesium_polylepis.1